MPKINQPKTGNVTYGFISPEDVGYPMVDGNYHATWIFENYNFIKHRYPDFPEENQLRYRPVEDIRYELIRRGWLGIGMDWIVYVKNLQDQKQQVIDAILTGIINLPYKTKPVRILDYSKDAENTRPYTYEDLENYGGIYGSIKFRIKLSQRDVPNLIFMIGIPGAGKGKWIQSHTGENTVVVSPDVLRKELLGNINDHTKNDQIWAVAKERAIAALTKGHDVILDATNVGSKNRKNFLTGLPPHKLLAKRLEGDPEISHERIQKQIQRGEERADVPKKAIVNMKKQFDEQSSPEQLSEEGFELI